MRIIQTCERISCPCGLLLLALLASALGQTPRYPFALAASPDQPGSWTKVNFESAAGHLKNLPEEERLEQLRDWALLAAFTNFDVNADHLTELLFDLSPLRVDYLDPLQDYKFGPGRAMTLPDGRLLAVVPEEVRDHGQLLGNLADQYRVVHGKGPEEAIVFQYRIGLAEPSLSIRREAAIPGTDLYSAAMGYVEMKVENVPDLDRFLASVHSLTFIRFDNNGFVLGGRQFQQKSLPVSREDLVAIYQSGSKLAAYYEDRIRKRGLREEYLDYLDSKAHEVQEELKGQLGESDYQAVLEFLKQKLPYKDFEDLAVKEMLKEFRPNIGFSLDPRTNYPSLAADLRKAVSGDEALYTDWLAPTMRPAIRNEIRLGRSQDERALAALASLLGYEDAGVLQSKLVRRLELKQGERDVFSLVGLKSTAPSGEVSAGETKEATKQHANEAMGAISITASKPKPTTDEMTEAATLEFVNWAREAVQKKSVVMNQIANAVQAQNIEPLLVLRRYLQARLPEFSLRQGAKGYMISDLQEMLAETGSRFNAIDGVFGEKTREAVQAYQEEKSLASTGVVDLATWKSLLETSESKRKELGALRGFLQDLVDLKDTYQCARYDGDFQGTSVGMTLFYTDLLMKLWGFDYEKSSPRIPGFIPTNEFPVSPIYWRQIKENPATRGWLGPRSDGLEFHNRGSTLLFAPVFTRIFNASSDPLFPGKEVPANYSSDRFSSWWNRNFSQVADFEPQYYRLNEIMKWSAVFAWLRSQSVPVLQSLAQEPVERSYRFNTWVASRPDLRMKAKLPFLPEASLGETTECLAIIESAAFHQFGGIYTIQGGVSLAEESLIETKKANALETSVLPQLARRPGVDYHASGAVGEVENLRFDNGRQYRIARNTGSVDITQKPDARFEGRGVEAMNLGVTRSLRSNPGQLVLEDSLQGHSFAQLRVSRGQGEIRLDLREGEVGRTLEAMQEIVDETGELQQYLSKASEEGVLLPGNRGLLVPMHDEDGWILISRGDSEPVTKGGMRMKLGKASQETASIVNVEFLPTPRADELTTGDSWQKLGFEARAGSKGVSQPVAEFTPDPPEQSIPAVLRWGKQTLPVRISSEGLYVQHKATSLAGKLAATQDLRVSLSSDDLRALARGLDQQGIPGLVARRLPKGDLVFMTAGGPVDDASASVARQVLSGPGSGIYALVVKADAEPGVRFTDTGILEISSHAELSDVEAAHQLGQILNEDKSFGKELARLRRIMPNDARVLAAASPELRRSFIEFRSVEGVPQGFALADLRVSSQGRILTRQLAESPQLQTLKTTNGSQLDNMRKSLVQFYDEKQDLSRDELLELSRPYMNMLRELAEHTKARRIVVREHDGLDASMIWTLHGGDPAVTFFHDQPSVQKSLEHAEKAVNPNVSSCVVASTVRLDSHNGDDIQTVAAIVDDIESFVFTVEPPLTQGDFAEIMQDSAKTQITLIARSAEEGILFQDGWVSFDDMEEFLEQHATPKDLIHIISNDEGIVRPFSHSGKFQRVVFSRYRLGDAHSFENALENIKLFYGAFSTPVAVFRNPDFEAFLSQVGPELGTIFSAAAERKGEQVYLDVRRIPAEARMKTPVESRKSILERMQSLFGTSEAGSENRTIDAIISQIGRDRIKAAGSPNAVRKAGDTLRAIPILKVELLPPGHAIRYTGYDRRSAREAAETG